MDPAGATQSSSLYCDVQPATQGSVKLAPRAVPEDTDEVPTGQVRERVEHQPCRFDGPERDDDVGSVPHVDRDIGLPAIDLASPPRSTAAFASESVLQVKRPRTSSVKCVFSAPIFTATPSPGRAAAEPCGPALGPAHRVDAAASFAGPQTSA
jgi:hypothetical protein